ncbi:foldase protein PrsA [Mycoplasma sp. CAG:776]|nr:foldase protein PrsA [Mycoplasma sp. CAG:776]
MKKKVLILGVCSLLLCGCGKIPTLSNGDEAVVTFKDGNMISANDFYEEIKNNFGLNTLLNMIDKFVFESEFADEMENANTYADAVIDQLKTNYGSEEELLSALQYSGYQTIEAYKDFVYISYLQNIAIEAYVSGNITEDELKEYYENDVYPDMTISHILITPDVTDDMEDEEKEKAENTAKETVEKIIDELNTAKKNGDDIEETFAKLAKEYSEDDDSKEDGGSLGEINIGSLDSNYDELVKAASELKDGEYSTEIITTELGYHVILKTKTGEKKSYDDSVDSMKESITKDKLTEDQSLMVDAIRYYRDLYELDIVDSELDSQYSIYMNNLINTYKNQNK